MLNLIRQLFVRHAWVETDHENRICGVCGATQFSDSSVEILGPTPWVTVKQGNIEMHLPQRAAAEKQGAESLHFDSLPEKLL